MMVQLFSALGTADAGVFLAAPCTGRHTLFDPRGDAEPADDLQARHLAAMRVCAGCPCTTSCGVLLDTLPLASRGRAGQRGQPKTVKGSMGQLVAAPLVSELRQHRATLNTLLRSLKLPEVDAGALAEQAAAKAGESERKRAAAVARWSREKPA